MDRQIIFSLITLMVTAACTDSIHDVSRTELQDRVMELSVRGYATGSPEEGGKDIESVTEVRVYHFEEGVLTGIYGGLGLSGNVTEFPAEAKSGKLYVLALTEDSPDIPEAETGTSETAWLGMTVASETPSAGMFFTGSVSVDSYAESGFRIPVALERGVARLDLRINVKGEAAVRSISLANLASGSHIFPDAGFIGMPSLSSLDIVPDIPYSSDVQSLTYLFEQKTDVPVNISVEALIDGRKTLLTAELPGEIRRNTVYTVVLRKDDITSDVTLEVTEWNDGGDIDIQPDLDSVLKVDESQSELSYNVSVSEDGRTVFLPHLGTELVIAVDSPDELELLPVDGYLLEVQPEGTDSRANRFRISKDLYAPGVPQEDVVLQFRRKVLGHVYPEDRIVLSLSANPVQLIGELDFDNPEYEYDFSRYADNEFGVFTLPEGKVLDVEFPDGEDKWIKIEPSGDGSRDFRVLGGWRPNDETADGRRQEAVLVLSNEDGTEREEYTVARRNYGLPVVYFHGVWWCKYNAMGNSRSFDDQILVPDDPAAREGKTLFDYLTGCTAEEYAELWGWAYQGDSGIGMRVSEVDGKAVLPGYDVKETVHINKLHPAALSPEGYEIPSMEEYNRVFDATDYIWMMWSGTHIIKVPWEGHSTVKREQKRKNGITVGSLTLDNLLYVRMWSPDFPDNEALVWYGPAAQWNADGILHSGHYNNILFAVYSPEGSGWYINGGMTNLYMTKNGAGNNSRILRFKKSDVEYIY